MLELFHVQHETVDNSVDNSKKWLNGSFYINKMKTRKKQLKGIKTASAVLILTLTSLFFKKKKWTVRLVSCIDTLARECFFLDLREWTPVASTSSLYLALNSIYLLYAPVARAPPRAVDNYCHLIQ